MSVNNLEKNLFRFFKKSKKSIFKYLKKSSIKKREYDFCIQRPFVESDFVLKNIPADWTTKPPDFVGISTGKAGTTWWWKLIQKHPQVEQNRLQKKALHYFYHFSRTNLSYKEINLYHLAFASPPQSVCGEWSNGYLNYPLALDHLKKAAPHTKLIAIIRNPLDRVISDLNQQYHSDLALLRIKKKWKYPFETFYMYPRSINSCFLSYHFKRLFELFDKNQLLILQYEKCVMNPEIELKRTYRFLGIDDSFQACGITNSINKKSYFVSKLDKDIRLKYQIFFEKEVIELSKLLPEIDLKLWNDFAYLQ